MTCLCVSAFANLPLISIGISGCHLKVQVYCAPNGILAADMTGMPGSYRKIACSVHAGDSELIRMPGCQIDSAPAADVKVMPLFAPAWRPLYSSGECKFSAARGQRSKKWAQAHGVHCAASCSGITGAERCTVAQGWPWLLMRRLAPSCLASLSCLLRVLLGNIGLPINTRFPEQESRQHLRATTPC